MSLSSLRSVVVDGCDVGGNLKAKFSTDQMTAIAR
jgi:hypothetical protein